MATITKGKTFVNGELVTPEKLHQLVDAATLSPLVNADIASNAAIADTKLAQISTAGKVLPAAVQGTAVITSDSRLSDARPPTTHNHDDRYYTETEMNTLLAGKQASGSYAPATGIAPSAITGTAVITTDSRLSDARTPIDSSVSFSKLVQAVQNTLVPTGSVVAFAFNASAGIPDGWLECNGFAVNRTTYNSLYSKIGVSYGSGDGSTTFNLPDLRGYFIRGSGTNSDGTASGSFATKQSDDVKPHTHSASVSLGNAVLNVNVSQSGRSTGGSATVTDVSVFSGTVNGGISIGFNPGTETRPKNIAMMYCIKF